MRLVILAVLLFAIPTFAQKAPCEAGDPVPGHLNWHFSKPERVCDSSGDCEVVCYWLSAENTQLFTPVGCFLYRWVPLERVILGPRDHWGRDIYRNSCRHREGPWVIDPMKNRSEWKPQHPYRVSTVVDKWYFATLEVRDGHLLIKGSTTMWRKEPVRTDNYPTVLQNHAPLYCDGAANVSVKMPEKLVRLVHCFDGWEWSK